MAEPELIHTGVGWRKVATSEASAETKASFTIPVIDLSDLGHSDIERRRDVAAQIYEACANVGFFYISNHGVSEELTTTAFSEAARFFDLPLEEKKKLDFDLHEEFWGYEALDGGKTREDNLSIARRCLANVADRSTRVHELGLRTSSRSSAR